MIKNYFLILKKIILFLLFFLIFSNKLYAANIKIYGDFELYPGDVIECDFPEISASSKIKNISKKKSGKYLIVDVAHLICPEGCYTKLNIIRDSITNQ